MTFSMKSAGFSLLLVLFAVLLSVSFWVRFHTMPLTPESESAFLKEYPPNSASKPFERSGSQWRSSISGAAGTEFVPHENNYWGQFAISPQQWVALMNALKDNTTDQLLRDKAQILNQSGDPRSGFHFDYKIGKSVGSVEIDPLKIEGVPAADGTIPVAVHVVLEEKYFRRDPGLITVKIETQTR